MKKRYKPPSVNFLENLKSQINTNKSIFKYGEDYPYQFTPNGIPSDTLEQYYLKKQAVTYSTRNKKMYYKMGFFGVNFTNFFIIDIDFHDFYELHYKRLNKKELRLEMLTRGKKEEQKIYNVLGFHPTVIEKTTRGFHLWYIFDRKLNNYELMTNIDFLLNKVNKLKVEVRNSTDNGTALPIKYNFLNERFNRIYKDNFTVIPFRQLIEAGYTTVYNIQDSLRETFKEDSINLTSSPAKEIKLSYNETSPNIENGESNSWLCSNLPKYFMQGWSDERITDYILANKMPNYTNELRNRDKLLSRIQAFRRNFKGTHKRNCSEDISELSNEVDIWYLNILRTLNRNKKREFKKLGEKNIKRLLHQLIYSQKTNKDIMDDPNQWSKLNAIYSYSIYNYKKFNAFPMPSFLLKNIHNYHLILHFLLDNNILSYANNKRQYSNSLHSCIHYVINSLSSLIKVIKERIVKKEYNNREVSRRYSVVSNIYYNMFYRQIFQNEYRLSEMRHLLN